jgi:hypothetical protein
MLKSFSQILFPYCIPIACFCLSAFATEKFHIPGEKPNSMTYHAFVGGDIQIDPSTRIKNAIMLVKNGYIESVGNNIVVPPYYREWNCSGKTIYPGLIDPYKLAKEEDALLSLGHKEQMMAESDLSFHGLPQNTSEKKSLIFWNPRCSS